MTRVVDGDTFWISSADERIRVWGLDAPEVDMPGGSQATAALTALISGQQLTCRQRDIDRYGRIVGQCFLPDGRDITAVMIESGTAAGVLPLLRQPLPDLLGCPSSGNWLSGCMDDHETIEALGNGPLFWFSEWPTGDVPRTGEPRLHRWDRDGSFVLCRHVAEEPRRRPAPGHGVG